MAFALTSTARRCSGQLRGALACGQCGTFLQFAIVCQKMAVLESQDRSGLGGWDDLGVAPFQIRDPAVVT